MTKLALGADPEFFLMDTKTERVISAHDMVPGTKKKPHKLKDGAVQVDGVAVEFNINPAFSADEFEHNVNSVMKEIRKMIDKRYSFKIAPYVEFDKGYFDALPDFVKELGCEPDLSCRTGKEKPCPVPFITSSTVARTAAGHLHLGWTNGKDIMNDEDHALDCQAIAKLFNQSLSKIFTTVGS